MTRLEVTIDVNPSKEVKGKTECRALVNTFSAHSNKDKNKLYVQIEKKIIFSIKEVIAGLLEDVASKVGNIKEAK